MEATPNEMPSVDTRASATAELDTTSNASTNNVISTSAAAVSKPFLQLLPPKKKRRRLGGENAVPTEFNASHNEHENGETLAVVRTTPLIIPAVENSLKWKRSIPGAAASAEPQSSQSNVSIKGESGVDDATTAAIRALQDEASGNGKSNRDSTMADSSLVIASHSNTFVTGGSATQKAATSTETQHYQQEINALPAELDEHDVAYQQTPIAEFGAALLRGMGWTDETNGFANKKSDEPAFPRPHRLGLGAIPAAATAEQVNGNGQHSRPRRPDQYQRDQREQLQNEGYRRERERQMAADKQRTLQNGSLVWIHAQSEASSDHKRHQRRRARIVKLVGVPGLNMVQVQYEGEHVTMESVVKRNEIDRLLTRQELDEEPFLEAATAAAVAPVVVQAKATREDDPTRAKLEWTKASIHSDDRQRPKKRDKISSNDQSSSTRTSNGGTSPQRQQQTLSTWLIPNIRVRVVTKRLGRKYYKEKGVVLDVTLAGATIHMGNAVATVSGDVLERVPDRYLETALPKVGGNVIVLAEVVDNNSSSHSHGAKSQKGNQPSHKFDKGRLLERSSRNGVVQVFDDMSVLTVPLDDLAEWCGPLDDDEER